MKTIEVTKLEKQVIDSLINQLYAEPGFSDVGCKEITDDTTLKLNTVKGCVGSLVKKGVFAVEDDFEDIIYLDDAFYHLHPDIYWRESTMVEQIDLIVKD